MKANTLAHISTLIDSAESTKWATVDVPYKRGLFGMVAGFK
ncbi:MAG: hypothetical protein ACPG8W_25685 [Candidatus Promineifilaceae bacterium]